jgi:hypothetical protein
MPAGGKRPNAGRKKGSPNKASAERAARVESTGLTPLDVMIESMRYLYGLAGKHQLTGETPNEAKFLEYIKAAREAAKDAAPYIHSKMSSMDATMGGPRDLSKLTDTELDDLERISRKIAGAFGNTSGEDPS